LLNPPDQETKIMNLRNTLTVTALSLLAFGAFAQGTSTPGLDARQNVQEKRIDKGVASGKLTPTEAKRMDAKEAHVGRVEDRAKADGTVTPAEKAHVTHAENKTSRAIKRQKHDGQATAPEGK
jgi:hypothetical protein